MTKPSVAPVEEPTPLARGNGVVELVENKLYRIGASLPIDGRVSWVPSTASGRWVANSYVLLEGDDAVILDPAFAAVEDAIVSGARSVVPESTAPTMFVTRSQYDCLGNAGAVAAALGLKEVRTGGSVSNPFDSFEAVIAYIKQWSSDFPGTSVTRSSVLELSPSRRLTAYPVKLRILATFWGYDDATKTLFTSDSFTHCTIPDQSAMPVVTDVAADTTTMDDVRAQLLASFHWLADADDVDPVIADVESVFEQLDVEIIAPMRGCVLMGRAVVEKHKRLLIEALNTFGRN